MFEAFATQLQTEAGLISAGLLIALLFMTRGWQKERDENRALQAELLQITRQTIVAEQEMGAGLAEMRRLVDANASNTQVLEEVRRELERLRMRRLTGVERET